MRKVLLVPILALVLLLAACSAQASGAAQPVSTAQPTDTARVNLPPSYRFDPVVIQVSAGTTVTWTNSDNFTHSVKVQNGDFPFVNLKPGDSGSITFASPGEYDYICTYHAQNMKGKVIVAAR